MKISYNWLKQYIDINIETGELAKIFTSIGLETGSIENYEPVKGGLKGLITGEVKTCIRHPNADKLSITTVDIGEKNLLQIVCGAPNVETGQKVIVATIGTILYKGENSFSIKESKIRGEDLLDEKKYTSLIANYRKNIELYKNIAPPTPQKILHPKVFAQGNEE